MQPIGQLAALLVGLCVLVGLDRTYGLQDRAPDDHASTAPIIDTHWRYVTGAGAIPTLVALIFRLTIPESARYTLDVRGDLDQAERETETQFSLIEMDFEAGAEHSETKSINGNDIECEERTEPFSKADLYKYFIADGNWRYLAGTSTTWFLLDVGHFF